MEITKENILAKAHKGNLKVLESNWVDNVKDTVGWTPLHYLAWNGRVEILKHPSVDQVRDNLGMTPLHRLAGNGKVEVLNHPSVDKVKDNDGWTPLHWLVWNGYDLAWREYVTGKVTKKYLKEKYPWYPFSEGCKVTWDLIEDILSTSNGEHFVLENFMKGVR